MSPNQRADILLAAAKLDRLGQTILAELRIVLTFLPGIKGFEVVERLCGTQLSERPYGVVAVGDRGGGRI